MRAKLLPLLVAALPLVLGIEAHAQGQDSGPAKLEKLPYSGGVLVARGIRNGTIHLQSPHWEGTGAHAPTLKCTPAPCALPNVEGSAGATQPVDETPIAVNPLNVKQMITGGNDYNCTSGSYRGFWVSNNGGTKWSGGCGVDIAGSSGDGDPIVGYDLLGNVFQGGIESSSVGIASSQDNGAHWNAMVPANTVAGDFPDKPWLQIDTTPTSPHVNSMYISNTMFDGSNNSTIYVGRSTDAGKTWKTVAASPKAIYPNVNQFSDLAIDSNGVVYLSYQNCTANGPAGDCGGTKATMYVQKSTDGGKTWSKQVAADSVMLTADNGGGFYGTLPNTSERVSNIPAIGVDNSGGTRNGQIYMVDYNWTGKFMQVQVTTSTDGGATWSAPVHVAPKSETHDQFFPWLNVDAKGDVGVTWLDRRNDPSNVNYEAFASWSANGGAKFKTNVQIADQASNPLNDGFGGGFMGDYTGNAWFGNTLFTSWTDTRNGSYSQNEVGGLTK